MANKFKRARRAKRSRATPSGSKSRTTYGTVPTSESVKPQLLSIPFEIGPSLECMPDDALHEILSHLPTLSEHHVLFGHRLRPPVIPSSVLVRTPTLRALSQTSRLLRSRCLGMAWQRLELCGARLPEHLDTFYKAISEATKAAITVLQGCPHLLPLIQTVSIVFRRYNSAEIIPEFAAFLATLPNLTTIQVHSRVTTALDNAFEGVRLPSVRQISLPCSAHAIIKSCPNLEEVTCVQGDGSTIVSSIIKGKCRQLRVLKGVFTPLKRLVKTAPFVRHIALSQAHVRHHRGVLSPINLPFLDTFEFVEECDYATTRRMKDKRPNGIASARVERASEILKKSMSRANKTVIVTRWFNLWRSDFYDLDAGAVFMTRKAIQL